MHKLLEWLRREHGDEPPEPIDDQAAVEELPDELADGYEPADE